MLLFDLKAREIATRQISYCKYYSQGIVVFLESNAQVDSKLLTDYYWV